MTAAACLKRLRCTHARCCSFDESLFFHALSPRCYPPPRQRAAAPDRNSRRSACGRGARRRQRRCALGHARLGCVVDTWWAQRRPAAPRVRSCSCGHAPADERAACCALQLMHGTRSVSARVSAHANAADAHAPSRHGRRGASGEPLRAIAPAASCRLSVRVALTPPCKRRSLASAGRSG